MCNIVPYFNSRVQGAMCKSILLISLLAVYAAAFPWHKHGNALQQTSVPSSTPGYVHIRHPCEDQSRCKSALPAETEAIDNSLFSKINMQICPEGKYILSPGS